MQHKRNRFSKRLFDVSLIIIFTPLIIPIFVIAAVLIRIKMGSPIFFLQERTGLFQKPFFLVKFRSMSVAKNKVFDVEDDEKRTSGFGHFLRETSIDELPALINVIKGEMSLVGPRPLPTEYLPRYSEEQAARHNTLPGITGLAQVRGRNELTWEERFAIDLEYVRDGSLKLDLFIIWKTVWVVLSRRGVTPKGRYTMEKF